MSANVGAETASIKQPYFGELHMHTAYSFDAFVFRVRSTPEDAYNFAKGMPLEHPMGKTYRLSRPLDFMAVTDHGAYMGSLRNMADPEHEYSKLPFAKQVLNPDPEIFREAFARLGNSLRSQQAMAELTDAQIQRDTWQVMIDSANAANEPGEFTALIGYEWTSAPDGQNLHRNVIFAGDSAPQPFTVFDSNEPEGLWRWMDDVRANGTEVLAIPHNANLSDGRMFERQKSNGEPIDATYADQRSRNEPLFEVTQVKGTSETHPLLSPNDEFAGFELVQQYVARPTPVTRQVGSYARDALKAGLAYEEEQDFNPFRFGLVGASDSHTGIVSVIENDFSGKVGAADGTPERRMRPSPASMDLRFFSAAGLTGVWASENTRAGIFGALASKETWATSGPRITVRAFAGFDMSDINPWEGDWAELAYERGVPMGGALQGKRRQKRAPTIVFSAMRDALSASLDRVQVVKGWEHAGQTYEKVYDVAWAGSRSIDPSTGKLPALPDTVDRETLEYDSEQGAGSLMGRWSDPDFDPRQNAFYYLRVLETKTPRWSMFDARELGIEHPADLAETIQERAYTSPIWYDAP
ncbi:MAG: DUF3604 domain-containing protein [Pseudomonadaceae bacterium]|nr:DUF3604 domain-containing protein [Pseudomonadaceae bacterium]